MSAPDPGVAGDGRRDEPTDEDLQRLGGEDGVEREHVDERHTAIGQGVNAHVTGIEKKHGGDAARGSGTDNGGAGGIEPGRSRRRNEQSAQQRGVAQGSGADAAEVGAHMREGFEFSHGAGDVLPKDT